MKKENIIIPISRIKNYKKSERSLVDQLVCKMCNGLILDAMDCSGCLSTFCRSCLENAKKEDKPCFFDCYPIKLSKSSILVYDTLNDLKISCCDPACNRVIEYPQIISSICSDDSILNVECLFKCFNKKKQPSANKDACQNSESQNQENESIDEKLRILSTEIISIRKGINIILSKFSERDTSSRNEVPCRKHNKHNSMDEIISMNASKNDFGIGDATTKFVLEDFKETFRANEPEIEGGNLPSSRTLMKSLDFASPEQEVKTKTQIQFSKDSSKPTVREHNHKNKSSNHENMFKHSQKKSNYEAQHPYSSVANKLRDTLLEANFKPGTSKAVLEYTEQLSKKIEKLFHKCFNDLDLILSRITTFEFSCSYENINKAICEALGNLGTSQAPISRPQSQLQYFNNQISSNNNNPLSKSKEKLTSTDNIIYEDDRYNTSNQHNHRAVYSQSLRNVKLKSKLTKAVTTTDSVNFNSTQKNYKISRTKSQSKSPISTTPRDMDESKRKNKQSCKDILTDESYCNNGNQSITTTHENANLNSNQRATNIYLKKTMTPGTQNPTGLSYGRSKSPTMTEAKFSSHYENLIRNTATSYDKKSLYDLMNDFMFVSKKFYDLSKDQFLHIKKDLDLLTMKPKEGSSSIRSNKLKDEIIDETKNTIQALMIDQSEYLLCSLKELLDLNKD